MPAAGGGRLYGGIEAGGTHFVCGVGTGPTDLRRKEFPTGEPGDTLPRALDTLRELAGGERLAAVGIASFGPVDLDPRSPTFGHITSTPKAAWREAALLSTVQRGLGVSAAIDTDVNGAALAEHEWGAARGLRTFVYLTVGTGIGGGGMAEGHLLHGRGHPEMGHMLLPRDQAADPFPGVCPYHGDCLEGLASGPALARRWGQDPATLPDDHPAWPLEARYLALGLANLTCVLAPELIIVGGGVGLRPGLLPLVQADLPRLLNGYVPAPPVVASVLGVDAGVLGALALAARAAA